MLTEDKLSLERSKKEFSVILGVGKIAASSVATGSVFLASVIEATGIAQELDPLMAFVLAYSHVTSL